MTHFLQEFIDTYGYLAVLVGTFLEGETILILGGLAAHLGYLELQWVIIIAFIGSLSGDQLWFVVGRRYGHTLITRYPSWNERVERIHKALRRYEIPVLLGFRFAYGFRNLTPFVVGLGPTKALRFVVYNAIGAFIWSVTVACAGYLFGQAVEIVIGDIKRYELWVIVFVLGSAILLWLMHLVRKRIRAGTVGR